MTQIAAGTSAAEIAESLEAAIRLGRCAPHSVLPSVRELAASLSVSPATVAAAYKRLHDRGLVQGDRRRGTRVRAPRLLAWPRPRAIPPETGVVDLASGNPDPALLPSLTAALRAAPETGGLYGEPPEMRAFAAFARSEFAADGIDSGELVVTSGALDAIDRVLREHGRVGDRVLVEDPCYPALLDLLAVSGFSAEPVPVDEQGPLPAALDDGLQRRARAVILTPRAQNPTGAAISVARAAQLRQVLHHHADALLIENDPLGPVAGAPPVTLTHGRGHWAIVRSLSKLLGPDLRVAVLAADATTAGRVAGRQAAGSRWVSRLLQHLALSLWSDPASGRQLARATAIYAQRRQALTSALAAEGVRVPATSGFNVWIPVRQETAVVQHLASTGWAVAAGERFRLRSGPGIRVTTSALEPSEAPRLARDLAAALRDAAAPPA